MSLRTITLFAVLSGAAMLLACSQKEEDKQFEDYVEEEMMRQTVLKLVQPAPQGCQATQTRIRFHNLSGTSEDLSTFGNAGCPTPSQSISATIANGTLSSYACIGAGQWYVGKTGGGGCGGPFFFAAGSSWTVTSTATVYNQTMTE